MAQQADPLIGRDILDGQFKIVEKIGAGGMGAVYKAHQPEMNRMVAVKVLHKKLIGKKDAASRFRREARALSHLTHPNTVRVMMYGELEDGSLYIVMEYLEGKNLHQLVRAGGPLKLERAIGILVQACGALEEAHQAGMIHRDLKPENIFICRHGGIKDFVKVLDFGLAKVTEREMRPGSIMLTQEGMVFGTPEFMAPEQAQGKALCPASDVYSLAIILYEALTGKLPFEGKNPMDFLQMHVTAPPIRLNERDPSLEFPVELEHVIDKALAKDAEKRYPSALAFGDALMFAVPLPSISRLPSVQNVSDGARATLPMVGAPAPKVPMDSSAPARASTPLMNAPVLPKSSLPSYIGVLLAFLLGIALTIFLMKYFVK